MHVRFVAPELKQIDALRCEALMLPLSLDERPLRGALGLVDWRLCGFVSRLVQTGALVGERCETLLLPGRPKLGINKLLIVGIGASDGFGADAYCEVSRHMLRTLRRAGVRAAAVVLPWRQFEAIEPANAVELFAQVQAEERRALRGTGAVEVEEWVVLDAPEAQRAMQPVIDRERRKARAMLP